MGMTSACMAMKSKTRYAIEILRKHKPALLTLHLNLDEAEHSFGPFSTEANQDLEAIDAMLAKISAASAGNAATILAVVSDHRIHR